MVFGAEMVADYGCNTGAAIAKGEYLLFLNSDTVMQPNTLDASVAYMHEHADTGGLGVQVVLQDGSLDHACKRGFPTPWNALCYFGKLDRLFPKTALFNGYRLNHMDRTQKTHESYFIKKLSLYIAKRKHYACNQ